MAHVNAGADSKSALSTAQESHRLHHADQPHLLEGAIMLRSRSRVLDFVTRVLALVAFVLVVIGTSFAIIRLSSEKPRHVLNSTPALQPSVYGSEAGPFDNSETTILWTTGSNIGHATEKLEPPVSTSHVKPENTEKTDAGVRPSNIDAENTIPRSSDYSAFPSRPAESLAQPGEKKPKGPPKSDEETKSPRRSRNQVNRQPAPEQNGITSQNDTKPNFDIARKSYPMIILGVGH